MSVCVCVSVPVCVLIILLSVVGLNEVQFVGYSQDARGVPTGSRLY